MQEKVNEFDPNYWATLLRRRQERLESLKRLKAPEDIIKGEQALVDQARQKLEALKN